MDVRTDGHLTHIIRSTLRSPPKNDTVAIADATIASITSANTTNTITTKFSCYGQPVHTILQTELTGGTTVVKASKQAFIHAKLTDTHTADGSHKNIDLQKTFDHPDYFLTAAITTAMLIYQDPLNQSNTRLYIAVRRRQIRGA